MIIDDCPAYQKVKGLKKIPLFVSTQHNQLDTTLWPRHHSETEGTLQKKSNDKADFMCREESGLELDSTWHIQTTTTSMTVLYPDYQQILQTCRFHYWQHSNCYSGRKKRQRQRHTSCTTRGDQLHRIRQCCQWHPNYQTNHGNDIINKITQTIIEQDSDNDELLLCLT